jgi:hypothetical protein
LADININVTDKVADLKGEIVNVSAGETKPLIPAYVIRGIRSVKTPESIAICFQKEGPLSEARPPKTYQRAFSVLTEETVIPEEVEIEEDLGLIEDDQVQEVGQDFDIEVNQDKAGQRDDTSSVDGKDEVVEEVKAPEPLRDKGKRIL